MDLLIAYSNPSDLLFGLLRATEQLNATSLGLSAEARSVSSGRQPRVWRVRDRLDDAGVQRLISGYQGGATARQLAEQFGIGMTSVKRLLRENRVRRTQDDPHRTAPVERSVDGASYC